MTAPAVIRQADVARLIRAARKEGCEVARVILSPDKVELITTRDPAASKPEGYEAKEW